MASPALSPTQNMPVGFIVTCTLFHSLAFIITTFRLIHRRRRKQCSWDDFWAFVAVCCNNVVFVLFWVRVRNNDKTSAGHPPSKSAARIVYLTMSLAFTATIWSARISIACSILRVLPHSPTRTLVLIMSCFFGLLSLFALFSKSWICGSNQTWATDCTLGKLFDIAKLTMDIVADVGLVVVPLYLLWHTSLPKGPRYMLRAIFATSISTTSISTLHAVYGLHPNRLLNGFTAHIESAVTVMLCNLLVVVTFIYRRFSHGRDLDDDEVTEYTTTPTTTATTTRSPRPRATTGIITSFMPFSRTSRTQTRTRTTRTTQLTTSFPDSRRGSSVFLEPPTPTPTTPPAAATPNAAQDLGHPSCTSERSSVESEGGSTRATKTVHGCRLWR